MSVKQGTHDNNRLTTIIIELQVTAQVVREDPLGLMQKSKIAKHPELLDSRFALIVRLIVQ
jgi:hypothetical protein